MHALLLILEVVVWWFVLAGIFIFNPPLSFTTLLPLPAYPVVIALGLLISMGALWQVQGNFAALGWAESMRLSFRQIVAIACAVFTLAVGLKDPGISRIFLAVYLPTTGMLLVFLNRYQPGWLVRLLFAGGGQLPTLIVGEAELFPDLKRWLSLRQKFGLTPVGRVTYRDSVPDIPELPIVGEFARLKQAVEQTGARQVLVLSLPRSAADAEHLAKVCASCGCRLLIHNNLTFQLTYPLRVLVQDGYSFLAFQDEPLEDPVNRCLKRIFDVAVAVPMVVCVLPTLALVVWIGQRVQSPGRLFYMQERSGRAGKTFRIVKFRTMHPTSPDDDRQTSTGDLRIFRFGRFLRRTSLDEFPQFLNVLAGKMSVVGPRPHYVRHDDLFADFVNEYRVRFFVKPGITGLAQSRGFRGEMHTRESIHQRLQLDLMYIHSWSVWLDVAILMRTLQQVFRPPSNAR